MEPGSFSKLSKICFDDFTVDLQACEIRKHGVRLRLQQQPYQVLVALLERPGEAVTREELRQRLWPQDVFVDYDRGLNKAVNRLREVLGDNADTPRFVETLPQRGYRFVAPVETAPSPPAQISPLPQSSYEPAPAALPAPSRRVFASLSVTLCTLVGLWFFKFHSGGASQIQSIAVLPLESLSSDKAQEYFSDGMTDELIGELAHITSLRVTSRTSVMGYKKGVKKVPQIARELNVDAVIEGTVSREGGKIRITAQLIRARDDRHLWSQKYESNLKDVIALQGEVARAIARQVHASLRPEEQTRLEQSKSINPAAYEAYLEGAYFLQQNIRGVPRSMELFRKSIELDATYAPAHAGLAQALIFAGIYEFQPFAKAYTEARAAAQRALNLDSNNAASHNAMADIMKGLDWDLEAAEREQRLALRLSPSHLLTRLWLSETLSRLERHDEALAESERALSLDPVSAISHNNRAMLLWRARRYDQAIKEAQTALDLDPSHFNALWWQGLAYAGKHDFTRAMECLRRGSQATKAPVLLASIGYVYGLANERASARDV